MNLVAAPRAETAHVVPLPPVGVDRPRQLRKVLTPRVMTIETVVGIGAVLSVPATMLLAAVTGSSVELAILPAVACLFIVPTVGVMLIAVAVVHRTRGDGMRLLFAVLSLPTAVALITPADRVGRELFVATRQAELDALAEDVLRAAALETGTPDDVHNRLAARFHDRMERLRISGPWIDGGALSFEMRDVIGYYALWYVSPHAPPLRELDPNARPLAGNWYGGAGRHYDEYD